ncbi:TM2 domain-containing protein 1 isoform X1 [Phyllopteryx taeniolatus]|uniref:TM2 domain-containing protein 1 isoform X1 n=1 Tax=Phyllopteryx taeniolatus TaxID=161469 RepID=UPI002AD3C583|nr:TM2 domain-containing protein 1 isoform X1 [Phyllopteryx taeniolatus]
MSQLVRLRCCSWTILLFFLCRRRLWAAAAAEAEDSCDNLRLGQYLCKEPKIDDGTQEPENCRDASAWGRCRAPSACLHHSLSPWRPPKKSPVTNVCVCVCVFVVECLPAPNVTCRLSNGTEFRFSGEEVGFNRTVPCRNVSVYSYKVAVALSLFLGWLGADRFYLGYPALGVLKFCTVGFCGIGTLVDFILIAVQMVGPSDGSDYIVDYYGARLSRLTVTERTYRKPHLSP